MSRIHSAGVLLDRLGRLACGLDNGGFGDEARH
jgi:hypothetical protein